MNIDTSRPPPARPAGLTVRLGCNDCDRDDCDGITPAELRRKKAEGWVDVERFQTLRQSLETYDNPAEAPPGYSVLEWYTHLGTCPDCAANRADDDAQPEPGKAP